MSVTVYTKPDCQPCRLVKMRLDKNGTEYVTHDITTDSDALARVEELGYKSVPVVVFDFGQTGGHFGGFSPDKIDALKS